MNGIIIINKPQEFTSFDVVAVMRKLSRQKKIGHTGTLDPMATGVLPVLMGNAAKAQDILPDSNKEYVAEFKLGIVTDTLDIWGRILKEIHTSVLAAEIGELIPKYTGEIMQVPPMYSAVKKDGIRLYDLARQGIEVERQTRKVTISRLKLLTFDEETQCGQLLISCSKGTYIRTLIDDIGADLGCGAVMTSLVRIRACGYSLEDAQSLDEIRELTNNGENPEELLKIIKPVESVFSAYRRITVSEKQANRFLNGNSLDIARTAVRNSANDGELLRVCGNDGLFLGLGKVCENDGVIKIFKLFKESLSTT